MKKLGILTGVILFLISCKSSSVTSTQLDRNSQVQIKGDWQITNVSYSGSDYITINSFGIADSKCFIGSTWHFVSNNNKGTLSLNATNCSPFSSPITWFINRDGEFILKVLNVGEKARKVREGYILHFHNQSESSFWLEDMITVGTENKKVIYQFQKIN